MRRRTRTTRRFRCALIATAWLVGLAATAEAFEGRLVDARTGNPVRGAQITIPGAPGATRSDADGRFTWLPDPRPPFTMIIILADGRLARPVVIDTLDPSEILTVTIEPAVAEQVSVVAGVAPSIDASPGAGMTLVTGEEIEMRAPAHLLQSLENVAGVSSVSEGQAAVPAVRGMAGGRTLILLDGGRVSSERRAGPSATFLDPATVEGIDVARGPGSVAYGSDALGGVISVRTRRPDYDAPLAVDFTGTIGAGVPDRRASVVITKGFGAGGVLAQYHARKAEDYDGPDGEVFNSGWRDQGFLLRAEGRLPAGVLSVGWQSDFGRDIERPRSNSQVTRFYYPYENSHRFTASFEAAGVAGFRQVKVSGLLGSHEQRTDQDRFATPSTPRSIERADISAGDLEVRATADRALGDGRLQIGTDVVRRFGLEAHDISVRFDPAGDVVSVDDNLSIDSASRTVTGVFAQIDANTAEALRLSGGLRGDVVRSVNSGGFFGDQSVTSSALAGFLAATVGPFTGVTVTGQVSRGFREPTLSDRFFRGPTGRGFITGNPDLGAERSLQFDGNVQYVASRVRVAAYVYHYRITDLVERFALDEDNFAFRNRGRARIRGVEIEVQGDLGHGAGVTVTGQVARGDSPDDDVPLDDISPPTLTVMLSKGLDSRGTAYLRAAFVADGDRPGPSEIETPGYVEVDAGSSWRLSPQLELRGAVRNLLNRAYYASPSSRWVYAPGRSASLSLVAKF